MSNKNRRTIAKPETRKSMAGLDLVFGNNNYLLMIIGFVVIVAGFVIMYGGKEDIYSFRRISLAPIVVITGFVIEVFAIMVKPKDKDVNESN
jgi:hypothetical protein